MGISKGYVSEPRGHPPNLSCSQANILINDNGHACLAGFGLLMIVSDQSTDPSSYMDASMTQWMSPELLDPERFNLTEGQRTKESDCYALGMAIYEILSGQAPFAPLWPPPVIWRVLEGQCPGRPEGEVRALFTDDIWRTLELCWKHQLGERISAKVVLQCLEKEQSGSNNESPPSELEAGFQPTFKVDRTIITCDLLKKTTEKGNGERLDATVGNSSTFSPFTEGLRLIFIPPHITSSVIPQDGGKYPTPERSGSNNEPSPSELEAGFRPIFKVDRTIITRGLLKKTIGTGNDERLDATVSNSSMFSPFTKSLRLTFNHLCGTTGPMITRSDCKLVVPPQSSRHTTAMVISTHSEGEEGGGSGFCNRVIICLAFIFIPFILLYMILLSMFRRVTRAFKHLSP